MMCNAQAIRWLLFLPLAATIAGFLGTDHAAATQLGSLPMLTVAAAPEQQLTNVFLPAPRTLKQRLDRARKALDDRRYSDAVLELGALLTDSQPDGARAEGGAQDYFIGPTSQPGAQTSLKAEAHRLLGEMPPEGREYYQLQFGADARAVLDQALAEGDAEMLTEVTRKYFHTEAGYEATMLLGRYQLDQGRPLTAALCFKRLAETPSVASRYDPELSVLLAACWGYANLPEKAIETLLALKRRSPDATLRAGDRQIRLFEDDSQTLEWLESLLGSRGLFDAGDAIEWAMFRGNAARNARSAGGLPLLNSRWRVPTANDPTDEKLIRQLVKRYFDQSLPALPSLHPLAVNDVVLMRSPKHLIAVTPLARYNSRGETG